MDLSQFRAPGAGRIVTSSDGYAAFVPAPLPPRLRYSHELVLALSRADAALGELSGVGADMPDPQLLDASFKRQEALCSSRIEGAEVSLSDLYLDQVAAARESVPRDHLREVRSCIATLRFGVERLREEPLSLELVRRLHERLLRGEIGTRTPGQFRTAQNWLGAPGSTLATATFVPPPVPEMLESLDAWESFLHERGAMPDLVQCALLHEQFEAIHPFVGGNGRLGRLLITLFLIDRRRLTRPLLYLSAYFEGHRDEYYALLQRVRTNGEWMPWLLFFVTGVRESAERATRQVRALTRQHAWFQSQVKGHALVLANELFRTPCMTVPEAQRVLDVTNPTARRAVRELAAKGLLEEYGEKHWPRVYLARPVLDAVLHPVEDLRSSPGRAQGAVLKSVGTPRTAPVRRADRLMAEAMDLIDTARLQGVTVRLIGGLAIRRHCVDLDFMDREYSDIDLVGVSAQSQQLHEAFVGLGYTENRHVTQATDGGQLQYVKVEVLESQTSGGAPARAAHRGPRGHLHGRDAHGPRRGRTRPAHGGRLRHPACGRAHRQAADRPHQQQGRARRHRAGQGRAPARGGRRAWSIDLPYLADVCAQDWGLYHDITTNIEIVLHAAGRLRPLRRGGGARVRAPGRHAGGHRKRSSKSLRWRLRASVGQRVAWRREIKENEGTEVGIATEWDWRRDLG